MGSALIVIQGNPVNLLRDVPAQAVGHVIGYPCHDKSLNKGTQGTDAVQAQGNQKDLPDPGKINASCTVDLRHQAGKKLGRRPPQYFRAHDIEDRTAHGKEHHAENPLFVSAHIVEQLLHRSLKILCLLAGHIAPPHGAVSHMPACFSANSITHWLIPPPKAGTWRSACKHRRSSEAPYGFPSLRYAPHPAQGSDPHAGWC